MPGPLRNHRRIAWLDGLRGLAAMQVVLLHYVNAFLPAVGASDPLPVQVFDWQSFLTAPFVYLHDGASAVYLFFIISGVVLTQAFASCELTIPSIAARRVIRLGLPMAAATLFAAALFSLLPEAHLQAGAQAGSTWLQVIGPATISLASIIHNIVFEGLLAGFHGFSLLPAWISRALNLSTTDQAFDTPLWTLHIELVGSLLVAMLVLVRRSASQTAYRITCLILGCSFVLSPLVLFILGHLVASRLRNPEAQSSHKSLGPALMMSGILLCTIRPVYPIMILWKFLPPPLLGIQCGHPDLQRIIGVMLVFGGLALLPPLQRQLQRHLPQWLGKVSFSLYLTHLPLEFTCVAAGFSQLARVLPVGASVAVASVTGIAGSLALAVLFERWIDRPAIILSRIASQPRRRLIAPQPAVRVP